MDITGLPLLLFLAAVIFLYYVLPRKARPWLLLVGSLLFLATYTLRGLLFTGITALIIWAAGLRFSKLEGPGKRHLLQLALLGNLLILLGIKYLLPGLYPRSAALSLWIPLGLSYYTLQAISYLLDTYWGRIAPETSFWKVLLYICYFPQMLQGPISRYQDLSVELQNDRPFSIHNLKHGVQLMLWGYFKIFVIGNRLAGTIPGAFRNSLYGFAGLVGLMLFGVELYCNFSGGIDVARGMSQCLGISLPENFRQPYFSKSLGEFWRRWHITLGTFMKDYVFFPFSMSKPISRFKKALKKKLPRKTANRIPIAIANIVVFLIVGIWHGSGTNYALWGLYNGIILAVSELLTDRFQAARAVLRIQKDSKAWAAFSMVRTFLIVTLGWATDCAVTAAGSLDIVRNLFYFSRTNLWALGISKLVWLMLLGSLALVILVSVIHEKGHSVREILDRQPVVVQCLVWAILIQMIACLGKGGVNGGLMYANF